MTFWKDYTFRIAVINQIQTAKYNTNRLQHLRKDAIKIYFGQVPLHIKQESKEILLQSKDEMKIFSE